MKKQQHWLVYGNGYVYSVKSTLVKVEEFRLQTRLPSTQRLMWMLVRAFYSRRRHRTVPCVERSDISVLSTDRL